MERTLDRSIKRVVKRYSSLFTLPSHRIILTILLLSCIVAGFLTNPKSFTSTENLALGPVIGLSYFIASLSTNYLSKKVLHSGDPLLTPRRLSGISIFSFSTWAFLTAIGALLGAWLNSQDLWLKMAFIGLAASSTMRLIILSVLSFKGKFKVILSSLLPPFLLIVVMLFIGGSETRSLMELTLYTIVSFTFSLVGGLTFLSLAEREGMETINLSSISLLRGFLADWMEGINNPFESILEDLGHQRDVKISFLGFRTGSEIKAVMAVPAIHPGPFKNVGSSPLPHIMEEALERRFRCFVAVPHGLSGHDLDLTSQKQMEEVLRNVSDRPLFTSFNSKITPMVKTKVGDVEAKCQIFGDCALITLTMSPKTMEDLPPEIDEAIRMEAMRRGLSCSIVIDAHNSIEGPFDLGGVIETFKEASTKSMDRALEMGRFGFEIGASRIVPEGFGVKDGMGAGGIGAIVVKTGRKKFLYVVIDGNNMISGLREEILSSVADLGIDDGEVMTTDTHVVNGVTLNGRGWHPIGEVIDKDVLIGYIIKVAEEALSNLEPAEASWSIMKISGLKVIGERQIETLSLHAESIAAAAKKNALILFPVLSLLLSSFFAFI